MKANAYGLGLEEVAPALWAAGARVFFVAHLSEGLAARRLLPTEATIYVLNGLERGAEPADYAGRGLAPVIGSEEELARWSAFAARGGRTNPCALHLDTGMIGSASNRWMDCRWRWRSMGKRAAPTC